MTAFLNSCTFPGVKARGLAYLCLIETCGCNNGDGEDCEKINPLAEVWVNSSAVILLDWFRPDSAKVAVDREFEDRDALVLSVARISRIDKMESREWRLELAQGRLESL
ncbi:hypothetical protein BDV28DRAFT_111479 [Aspergillus coremiiformis]|uniref:Uncharacterized protein n=1 Tax=Aspergillus coremiiformis TaxID=138285 RepID=A0A5N6Z950_9EURO|nr:hypothetical protein BDV28DRAFT_111479 [Aspergillus coremiiformis]